MPHLQLGSTMDADKLYVHHHKLRFPWPLCSAFLVVTNLATAGVAVFFGMCIYGPMASPLVVSALGRADCRRPERRHGEGAGRALLRVALEIAPLLQSLEPSHRMLLSSPRVGVSRDV